MTDTNLNSLDMVNQLDSATGSSPDRPLRPSNRPHRGRDHHRRKQSDLGQKAIWALPYDPRRQLRTPCGRHVSERMGRGILPSMDTHCRSLCNAIAADRRTILGQKTVVAAQARRNGRRRILDGIGDLALGPHRVRSLQYSGFGRVPRSA